MSSPRGPPPSVLRNLWGRLWKRTKEGGGHQAPAKWELPGAGGRSGPDPGGLSVGAAMGLGGQRSPAGPPMGPTDTTPRGHRPTPTGKGVCGKSQGPWALVATARGGPATELRTARETLEHPVLPSYMSGKKILNLLLHIFKSMWINRFVHTTYKNLPHFALKY